ncbi:MAG: 3-hydroxyacyl-CoA dehydrogenase/enoyl-CoA hydratase family protein [Deltaproteobacteria bacterium]|nr:3-hydroxyacyl-CoA dehydrogenase/enoyl-CoA hydratase family protein [Deltaproteobacteria bacterium]
MNQPIRTAAVLGAGVMGAGIAAHLANAGCRVLLLDIVPPGLSDAEKADPAARNRFAVGGLDKALKARPTSAFYHPSRAALVQIGNLEDDLERAAKCDLIIEAIIESMEPKRALFARLEPLVTPHTLVASNTSGLRIAGMLEGRGEAFRRNFMVIHFFNPPRHMKLLELVPGAQTDPEAFARVRRFGEDALGKGVVVAKDTPNFIGNRIGAQAMMACIHQMLEDSLAPEDVDALAGPPLGRPKSAAFRTADLVGLDTFAHVANNCYAALTEDEDREVFKLPEYLRDMVEKKLLGDKTRGGFYKKGPNGVETYDPYTRAYRPKAADPRIAKFAKSLKDVEDPRERLRATFRDQGPAGAFAWKVLKRTLSYAARRVGEISDDVGAIDDAMRWGYNWELGPFETWDALGFAEVVDRMVADGVPLPEGVRAMRRQEVPGWYRGGEVYSLARGTYVPREESPKRRPLGAIARGAPVLENAGAVLRDVGDGVAALTFKTKMNSVDPDAIELLDRAVDTAERQFQGLLLYNEGEHFCVGANLMLVVMAAMQGEWEQIRGMAQAFQRANQRLKYAHVPVVAAPYGMTLGGGLELCLGAAGVQAAAETYAGLVEVGVGLVPAGGGCMNLLWRALEAQPEGAEVPTLALVTQVFKNIALAKVATSADEARALGYFRPTDGVTFDRARLLYDARERCLGLARAGWRPPAPRAYKLPGQSGIATLKMMVLSLQQAGQASAHDATVALRVAEVLCGGVDGSAGPVSEERLLELEAESFVRLCGEEKSRERMQYMLMNNKPLRN